MQQRENQNDGAGTSYTGARWQFSVAAALALTTAAAMWLALVMAAGWRVAIVAACGAALVSLLAFGWYHAFRPQAAIGRDRRSSEWLYLGLVLLIIALSPIAAAVAIALPMHWAGALREPIISLRADPHI